MPTPPGPQSAEPPPLPATPPAHDAALARHDAGAARLWHAVDAVRVTSAWLYARADAERAHGLVDEHAAAAGGVTAEGAPGVVPAAAPLSLCSQEMAAQAPQFLRTAARMSSESHHTAAPDTPVDAPAPPPARRPPPPPDASRPEVFAASAQAVERAHVVAGNLRRVADALPTSEDWAVQFVERTMRELGAEVAVAGRLTDDGALDVVGACGRGADLLVGVAPVPREAVAPLVRGVAEGRLQEWPTRDVLAATHPALAAMAARLDVQAAVIAPAAHLGRVAGALAIGWGAPRRLTPAERSLLRANAGRLARSLARGRLYYAERAARAVTERARQTEAAARADADAARLEAETARADAEVARADAERANRAKDEFLAVVSHELRTPMQAILGFSDLLTTGIAGPLTDRQRDYVARVQAAGGQLLDTIENLLGFARAQAGKENVHATPFDAAASVGQVLALAAPLAERKGLALRQPGARAGVSVTSDERKVRQILTNLVANAVKFTPHGEVAAWAERAGDRVRLVVQDTGVGIAPEQQARVFEPFVQVEGATTRAAGGTGLGLSIVRQLVGLLEGEVRVESAVGRGSTFTVELPRKG